MSSIDRRFQAKNGLDNNNNTITNVSDPVNAQDAATKNFSSNANNITSGVLAVAYGGTGANTATQARTNLGLAIGTDIQANLGYTPVNRAGDTMTGLLVLSADPSAALGAATKQYVDNVASGLNVHLSCRTATTAALTASYNNGTSGVGATLTGTGALPSIGDVALNNSDRVLVKNQANTVFNGIYTVTSNTANWVLTRSTDFDNSPAGEVVAGDTTFIQEGTLQGTQWVMTTSGTISIGTSSIVFTQFGGPGTYTAGTGIDITNNVITNTGVVSITAGTNLATTSSNGSLTLSFSGTLPVANGGTGVTTSTGTGSVVLSTSPTLTTPNLGTPSAVTLTNATGLPLSTGVTGTLAANSGGTGMNSYTAGDLLYANGSTSITKLGIGAANTVLTSSGSVPQWSTNLNVGNITSSAITSTSASGVLTRAASTQDGVSIVGRAGGTSSFTVTLTPATLSASRTLTLPDAAGTVALTANKLSAFASTTSAELAGVISDETGSGSLVFATSPTLVTPTLGVATATSINKLTITAPATSATLTIADGKTLSVSNTLTLSGTDSSSIAFGTGGTVAYQGGTLAQFASTTSSQLAGVISDETGTGSLVFATSPSLTTPALSGETFSTANNVTAGTNAQGQGALTNDYNVITTASSNPSGVTLPTATLGRRVIVVNKGANAINVYPATGGTIDALSANASIQVPVNGWMMFNASSTTQWYSSVNSVENLSFATGTLGVANGGTGLTSGTSGGVLYYSAAGTLASSGALAANALVVGGGAGAAPSTITTGTGVVTALGVNTGSSGAFVVNGGALGTPSSGTVTNLTGTASININGTVGATTPNTGAFTSLSYSTTLTGGTGIVNLGSGQFYKAASGNVGIGTTGPDERLVVIGGITTSGQAAANKTSAGTFDFYGVDNATRILSWGSSGVGGRITFWTGNGGSGTTEKMRINSDGKVAIGGTAVSTQAVLTLHSSLGIPGVEIRATDGAYIQYYNSSGLTDKKYWRQATNAAGEMFFETLNDAYSTSTIRVLFPDTGGVVVGNTALSTSATTGFLYVPTCAGVPTGTPVTRTGTAPMVIDTTNHRLYFYSGGAWRNAGP